MSTSFDDEELMETLRYDGCAYEESECSSEEESNFGEPIDDDVHVEDETENAYGNEALEEEDEDQAHVDDGVFMCSMQFKSSDEAYNVYNEYAKCIGFSVRKDIKRCVKDKLDPSKTVEMKRRFVCSAQGHREKKHFSRPNRKRTPRNLTRYGCNARFEVVYDVVLNVWRVNDFVSQHNGHQLVPPPSSMFGRSHRNVSEEDAMLAKNLNDSGVRKCDVMNYFVNRAGSFSDVGFIKRDLYNTMDRQRQNNCSSGDARTLVSTLENLSKVDPSFYHERELNESRQLVRLFWTDSESRRDYRAFGDLLLFDSTYRSNQYSMPILIFAGVNNHRQTVVFGFALMIQETIESYIWALRAFLRGMGGDKPKSVITDGDPAIRKALKSQMPSITHRLCSWHILQNCKNNVKIRGFLKRFTVLMFMKGTPEEFETKWEEMLTAYGVHDHSWVKKIYKKRKRWAESYLHGNFFAGCRSNQRCESQNSVVRHYVKHGMQMVELFDRLTMALANIRHREHQLQVLSSTSQPVIFTHLTEYAEQAKSLYTLAAFDVFRKQLENEAMYSVDHKVVCADGVSVYTLSRHKHRNRKSTVEFNPIGPSAKCSCELFESYGFPCRHMISVFKNEDLNRLPMSCILRRWTKEVKLISPIVDHVSIHEKAPVVVRYAELMQGCKKVCSVASKSGATFERFKEHIAAFDISSGMPPTTEDCSQIPPQEPLGTSSSPHSERSNDDPARSASPIGNPPVVPSKGRPPKRFKSRMETQNQNHCSYCNSTSHTVATCSVLYPDVGCSSRSRALMDEFAEGFSSSDEEERNNVANMLEVDNVGGRLCTGCSKPGHNRQTCPKLKAEGGHERAPRKKRRCSKCDGEGHTAPKCPMVNASSNQGGQDNVERKKRKCTNCREEGHTANKCPTSNSATASTEGGQDNVERKKRKCTNCREGHTANKCLISNSATASTEVDGVEKIIGEDGTVSFVVST